MARKLIRNRLRGQGLAEYALTIALVGLAAMAILFVVGMAVSRVYGLVAGSMGGQTDYTDPVTQNTDDSIAIESADCYIDSAGTTPPNTQIDISIDSGSGVKANDITVSTPGGFLTTALQGGGNAWSQDTIYNSDDPSLCPITVVVQTLHHTAVRTVTIHNH